MNSGHALIVQSKISHFQRQAQEQDAEVHRQQRELQALRVKTYTAKTKLLLSVPWLSYYANFTNAVLKKIHAVGFDAWVHMTSLPQNVLPSISTTLFELAGEG